MPNSFVGAAALRPREGRAGGAAVGTVSACGSGRRLLADREAPGEETGASTWARQRALEAAGVVFIDEDGGGPGVRLRDRLEG